MSNIAANSCIILKNNHNISLLIYKFKTNIDITAAQMIDCTTQSLKGIDQNMKLGVCNSFYLQH